MQLVAVYAADWVVSDFLSANGAGFRLDHKPKISFLWLLVDADSYKQENGFLKLILNFDR